MTVERIKLEECDHAVRCALGTRNVHIWSAEHGAYWRYPANGYTTQRSEAGTYSLGEAWRRTRHCDSDKRIEFELIA